MKLDVLKDAAMTFGVVLAGFYLLTRFQQGKKLVREVVLNND